MRELALMIRTDGAGRTGLRLLHSVGDELMKPRHMLAFDLGAGSGRAVLGTLTGERLQIKELHRFPNRPLDLAGHLHWDFVRLFSEMQNRV